jgi:hypothetical protein
MPISYPEVENGNSPGKGDAWPANVARVIKHHLYSQQYRYGDSYVFAPRSRFIPDGILDPFECRAWSGGALDGAKAARASLCADVAARMREMWR